MKKTITELRTIITCIFFIFIYVALILLFGSGIVAFLITFLDGRMDIKLILFLAAFALAIIGLSFWGLTHQIKKLKKEKIIEPAEYTEKLNIHFKSQISYKDYRGLMLELSFKKPLYIILFIYAILCAFPFFLNDITLNDVKINIIVISVVAFVIPLLTLLKIKKGYQTDKTLQEQLNYTLNNNEIQFKGETIDSVILWTHYVKIKEMKNFFLLYQSGMIATMLPKKAFKNEEIILFREFVKSLNLKAELFKENKI